MIRAALPLMFVCAATPVAAHPHVFVQAKVEVLMDQGQQVTGVRLTWVYDDYFSLLLTADLGVDLDGDMILTSDEEAILAASVTDWPPDFEGDLYLAQGDVPVGLGPPQDHTVELIDGLVHESHTRPLPAPATAGPDFRLQVYDPYFYVAYEIAGDVVVTGGIGCTAEVTRADLDSAYAMVEQLLGGRAASDVGPDEEFPPVGQAFADTIGVTCSG
jgi:ABC-type uncharacterized transport system substrate-binding protein